MKTQIVDLDSLVRNWWALLLRGIASLLFGAFTFVRPDVSLAALVVVFGAFAFVDGVFAIVSATNRKRDRAPWWVMVLQGLAGIAMGVTTWTWPGVTVLVLVYLIATWALVTGVFEVVAALRLRKQLRGEWLLALSGIASVALGVAFALFPRAGALALTLWIGAYAFVMGPVLIALSIRLHGLRPRHEQRPSMPAAV
jgi:uncharacterized membrane protein HdeD (DUF308 family)